jgi:hypothetical protein
VHISADAPIDRLTVKFTPVKWSDRDTSLHSPKTEVLIVDDEVQTGELLSEFCRAQE